MAGDLAGLAGEVAGLAGSAAVARPADAAGRPADSAAAMPAANSPARTRADLDFTVTATPPGPV